MLFLICLVFRLRICTRFMLYLCSALALYLSLVMLSLNIKV